MTAPPMLDYVAAPTAAISWSSILQKLGALAGLVLAFAYFSVVSPATFFTFGTIELILRSTAIVGTAALGMTMIIISAGIDLSVGSQIALVTVLVAKVVRAGHHPLLGTAYGMIAASVCGLVVGAVIIGRAGRALAGILIAAAALAVYFNWSPTDFAIVNRLLQISLLVPAALACFVPKVPLTPFIVTLGALSAIRGIALIQANNNNVELPAKYLRDPMPWIGTMMVPLTDGRRWMLLPPGVWLTIFLALLIAGLLRYSKFGRHIFAVGSNEQTARLCGINVEWTKLLVYSLAGLLTGIAGVMEVSRLRVGDPGTAVGRELDMIAAVVIGGGSLSGGQGSVLGTLIGALLMTVVRIGCVKVGYSSGVQMIVTGVIIVVAVALDELQHRRAD